MKGLDKKAKKALERFAGKVSSRIDDEVRTINQVQEDPVSGSVFCEIDFNHHMALVWVRTNGSIAAIDGSPLLLASGLWPKKNPSLDSFLHTMTHGVVVK